MSIPRIASAAVLANRLATQRRDQAVAPALQRARRMRGGRHRRMQGGDWNDGMTGKNWPAGVPKPGTAVDPGTWPDGATVAPALSAERPPLRSALLSDDADPRASEQRRMMQQYAAPDYWKGEAGAAMLELAQNRQAPADAQLADYYRAQGAAGIGGRDEIVAGLSAGLEGAQAEAMATWAKANPMLAFREYNKRFPAGEPAMGPSDGDIRAALQQGTYFASEGSPHPLGEAEVLPVAPRPVEPQQARQQAMEPLQSPQDSQALATGTAADLAMTMQPPSAAAGTTGVEPAQPLATGNSPNPADPLIRDYLQRLRQGRSARLGYEG